MTTILGLMILLLVRDIHVDTVSLCDDWKYLEVIEKSDDNTFTCTGLREQQDVVWFWDTFRVATCPPPTSTCTVLVPTANTFFRFSRTSTTASNITALATAAQSLDFFGTARVTCEISAQESVTCPLDSVYPAENITCKVQVNEDTWDVTSWCLVSKVRSTRQKYGCHLYQTQGSQEPIRVGSYNMTTVGSTLSNYSSGTCNMTSYLPSDGRYSYTVLIMPGKVNVPAVFYGNNEIRRPKSVPHHNCPPYVKEDNPVSCVCSVDDLGSPPGQLKWNNMSSEQLLLPGVKMDQHGVNYVCSLTWNKTVVQSVTYTLLVAYPPTQISFKVNNAIESVIEKSPVTMLCQSDGRPTPNMTITDVTNGNRVLHSQPGGNVTLADQRVETRYDKATAVCEDTGEYRCSVDNTIGSKYQAVKLFVICEPRRNPADANYTIPAVAESKSATIELIAYPTSVNVTKYFLGPNISSDEQPAKEGVFRVVCNASSPLSYKINCTITVINVTSDTAGFYKVIVINQAGNVTFAFQALPRNATVKLCNAVDEYIEVVEGKPNNTFTCSGLNAKETVTWILTDVNSEQWIGTCPQLLPNGTLPACTLGSLPMFSLRRISGMESVIAVDTAKVTDASLFARKSLKCQTTEGSKQTDAICQLDFVYPAEGVKCTVQLNGDAWSVTGYCTISKVYSSSGRYGCLLYQSKTEPPDFTLAGNYSLETSSIPGTIYSSGNCSLRTYLPPEGRYSYRVIVTPGSANVSALFIGADTIYRPSSSPSNNCPQHINEGSKLSCSCFANDLGSPSGKVQWDNTSSAQLIKANVSAADYGAHFTCYIMWNYTATESVTYTLFVMYQPNFVELKINLQSKSVTVNESETVNIACQANGQPMPTLRLEMDTGREIRVVLGGSVSKTNEKTVLTYTLQGVRVQDTGLYTCLANNGLGRDVSSSAALYVKGPLAAIRGSFSSEKGNYPFINFRGSPETLTFDVLTYETPKQYTFVFLGTDPNTGAVLFPRLGVLKSGCVSGDILQKTMCSITATNITEDEVGFYNLTLENSMGSLTVTFHLQRYAQDSESNTGSQSNLQLGLGIGLGTAAVTIVIAAIALICLYKRRRGNKNKDHSNFTSEDTKEDNDCHSRSTAEPEHSYDAIRSSEIEMRSSYMDLQGYTTCGDEQRKSNVYESPVATDSRESEKPVQMHTYINL